MYVIVKNPAQLRDYEDLFYAVLFYRNRCTQRPKKPAMVTPFPLQMAALSVNDPSRTHF